MIALKNPARVIIAGIVVLVPAAIWLELQHSPPSGPQPAGNSVALDRSPGSTEAANSATKPRLRKGGRVPGNSETMDFLKTVIVGKLELDGVPFIDALEALNREIAAATPAPGRPEIRPAPGLADSNPPRVIRDFRIREMPVLIALKYMGDQARCRFWIYQGNVYVEPFHADSDTAERFLRETRLKNLAIPGGTLVEALEALNTAAFDADFFGPKTGAFLPNDSGNGAKPVEGLQAGNISFGDALADLCRQTGMRFEIFEGKIHVVPNGSTTPEK